MRAKSLALLVLALGCGLVASIGITQVMAKKGDKDDSGATRTVFVVVEELKMGTTITADLVKSEKWPVEKVPEDAPEKFKDIDGRLTKLTLLEGDPIVERRLFKKGENRIRPTLLIPSGYRAVAVRVDQVTSAGFIKRGDRVDVLMYLAASGSRGSASIQTLLEDVKVFSINAVVEQDEGEGAGPIRATTVELLLTPPQTLKVALADKLGDLRLIPRGLGSEEEGLVDTKPLTEEGLLFEKGDRGNDSPDLVGPEPEDEQPTIVANLGSWLDRLTGGGEAPDATETAEQPVPDPTPTTVSPPLEQPLVFAEPEKTPNRYGITVWVAGQSEEVWLEEEEDGTNTGGMGGNWKTVDPNDFSIPSATTLPPQTPPATTQPSTTEWPATQPPTTEPAAIEPPATEPEEEPESFDQDSVPTDEVVDGNGETILEIDPGGDD